MKPVIYLLAAVIYLISGLFVNGLLHRLYTLSYAELLVHPIYVVLGGMLSVYIAYQTVEQTNEKKK